ncbi:MAG: hypothetical protein HGB17_11230 [Syntrophobacteraceae bacterium]|nr:hypothetical protein [Syntrophobacteraceae bacterium]
MKPKQPRRAEKGAIALLDDAAQLLRFTPALTWLSYLVGTLPFILSFLFFCGDMSTSATATDHQMQASLGLAILYLWMKCWQTVYSSRLHGQLAGQPAPSWSVRRIARLVMVQLAVTPWKTIALPLALLITLPFGWCYAFFHNATCTGSGTQDLRESVRGAWRLSTLWPKQNHQLIFILSLFSIFVFANLSVFVYVLPEAIRQIFGVDSNLSRSSFLLKSSAFWLSMAALTYLCMNPLVLAAYVLRCRDGAALETGDDLFLELGQLAKPSARLILLLVTFFSIAFGTAAIPGMCAQAQPPAGGPIISTAQKLRISPEQLNDSIEAVMRHRGLTWKPGRTESKPLEGEDEGFLSRARNAIIGWAGDGWKWIQANTLRILDWLEGWIPRSRDNDPQRATTAENVQAWLGSLMALFLVSAFVLVRRGYVLPRRNRIPTRSEDHTPALTDPDLNREDILADELPISQWMALAGECLTKGELRLGLRALHLASMTHLAERGFLSITQSKSNREYTTELSRRAHALPGLIRGFSANTLIVERIWYGSHSLEKESLERFLNNHKRIMTDGFDQ